MIRTTLGLLTVVTLVLLACIPVAGQAAVVYVDADNAGGPWNGNSWATAYKSVQEGLDAAEKAGGGQVWVAEGTYKPTSTTDRSISIQLKPGVALYGGFKGSETALDERDWVRNVTTLSGDIGKPGVRTDNSNHVVVSADDAIIDGFTVTAGYAIREGRGGQPPPGPGSGQRPGQQPGQRPGPPPVNGAAQAGPGQGSGQRPVHTSPQNILRGANQAFGAGILNYQTAPTVRNCIIKDNHANKGGGMYNMASRSAGPGPGAGGEDAPAPTVINCTFIGNSARARGGGVSNDLGTHPTFINCTFLDNKSGGKGGGMYNDFRCSPTITNCVFARNVAFRAAAMGNDGSSSPKVTNCTFTLNRADDFGAAMYQGTGPSNNPVITNSIFWGNIAPNGPKEIVNWHESNPTVSFSCVEGGYPGLGNIDADPLFVDPENGDFRLQPGSPCIDAGNGAVATEKDRAGNPRYDDKGMPNGALAALALRSARGEGGPPAQRGQRRAAPAPSGPPVDIGAFERQDDTKVTAQSVVYVDTDNAAGPGDGKSWATAFRSLQRGLDYAYSAGAEVWVAEGTYRPTSATDRLASFLLRSGVALYGGFKGAETARDQRNWRANATILSGDIGRLGDPSDNSYHVLIGADEAAIDGFTITGGNADGELINAKGGGMVNYVSKPRQGPRGAPTGLSPKVLNCTFTENHALDGGAVYNYDRGSPEFINCTFTKNSADYGGAILDRVGVTGIIKECIFEENYATWRGGALLEDYGSRTRIIDSKFINNSTDGHGGGMYLVTRASQLEHTAPVVENSTFTGNRAKLRGGGISNFDFSLLEVTGSSFTGNHAGKGGGGVSTDYLASTTLKNCTFSGNSGGEGKDDIDTGEGAETKVSGQ